MNLSALRNRFEGILFEGSDSAIPKGRLSKKGSSVVTESGSELVCSLTFGGLSEFDDGVNPMDGFFISKRTMSVEINQQMTMAGEDFETEHTESTDAGTIESITDRLEEHAHLIRSAFTRVDNWAGLTPHLFNVEFLSLDEPTEEDGIATSKLTFSISTRENIA